MKIRRQKQAKKTLSFYKYNFGFRPPLQVLVDGTFCQAALSNKIQIKEQLPKYLMGDVHLCTTGCVLKELESLGKELYGAKLIAQRFQVRNCSHVKNPVGGSACLFSMIGESNLHHYFIATQDQALAGKVKKKAGVPLMFIIQNTIVLDKPSPRSMAFVQTAQADQLVPIQHRTNIEHLKEEQGITKDELRGKKRKRTSGPNPLSCLKKKKKGDAPPLATAAKKRQRKRKRGRSRNVAAAVQLGKESIGT
ncbi:rRNA-processing protein UTP23 homolog [Rhinatrema bivittatum]|uniref:rRNA-processing protein UTP23 homolog n=1 Tax=Rhinatrema bivittatum TaxID=194408 RepID=UPI00112D6F03|nr:rRNA-processing protein UTP23 homolog [Rhinatrema bivittatum]XP_029447781.1 rRNA-processing protein UTP23 homolog [Rhinatrema bivittatum]